MRIWIVLGGAFFVAACGGSDNNLKCGTGTTEDNGECVATGGSGSGSGTAVTCGTGTQLDSTGTMCEPIPPAATGAPAITMMDPPEYGVFGTGAFEITGTGFQGPDITELHVYFGDTTPGMNGQLGPCEAVAGASNATTILGQIPSACSLTPTIQVTVSTNLGSATTPFKYAMVYAGAAQDTTNGLFLIDPSTGFWGSLGTLTDGTDAYSVTGLTFAADGTLYASSTSPVDQLITIDLASCLTSTDGTCTVTPVGAFTDGTNNYRIADLKFSGATLYGWTASNTTLNSALVQIDPATGAVTTIGADATGTFGGGIAVLADGTLVSAAGGGTGDLSSISTTDGTLTSIGTLDFTNGNPINAMTTLDGFLLASVAGAPGSLIVVDTTTAQTQWITEMPSVGGSLNIDAIEAPPSTLVLSRRAHIEAHAPVARSTAQSTSPCGGPVAVNGGSVTPARGQRLALSTVARGTLAVATCDGHTMTIAANQRASYALTMNRRGIAKLVDTHTGRTVLRRITSITSH